MCMYSGHGALTVVDACGLVFGGKDLKASLDAAVVASRRREADRRLQDEEFRVRGDVKVLTRLGLGRRLVVDVGGVLNEGAVNFTYDLLLESGELDGARAFVASRDLPRSLLVYEAIVDNILDGALAELASGEENTVPALLLFGELRLSIVVVSQPKVRQEPINGGATVLGSLRGSWQDLSGRSVTLNTPVKHSGHGGLEVNSTILGLCDIAVDPQHVVVGRRLQSNRIIATFGANSGEEITSHISIAVSGLGESEDVCNFEVLRFNGQFTGSPAVKMEHLQRPIVQPRYRHPR